MRRAREPIKAHAGDDIHFTRPGSGEERVERGAPLLGPTDAVVDVLERLPPAGRREGPERSELILWLLFDGRHARVERGSSHLHSRSPTASSSVATSPSSRTYAGTTAQLRRISWSECGRTTA